LLVDLTAENDAQQILSERFFFDLNGEQQGACKMDTAKADIETRSRRAIFAVPKPHARIYLVLLVDKLLQGDMNTATETYIKVSEKSKGGLSAVSPSQPRSDPPPLPPPGLINPKGANNLKAATKQTEVIAPLWEKRRHVHMPFAWAARPVYQKGGVLDTRSPFSPLFRQEPDRLLFCDLFSQLQDYEKVLGKTLALNKMRAQVIPGVFQADVEPFVGNQSTVDPAFVPVKPYREDKEVPPRREVQSLIPTVLGAHLSYINFFYVYPETLNLAGLSAKKLMAGGSAQNILCRAQLLETDKFGLPRQPVGGRCVFGRSNGPRMTDRAQTWVLYHNKVPQFNEEMKFILPASLSSRHHILFTFYHASVFSRKDAKKGRDAEGLALIGYAVLPLLSNDGRSLVRGNVGLRVTAPSSSGGAGSTNSASGDGQESLALPPNYTLACRDMGRGMDLTNIPRLRWLDSDKELFGIRSAAVSTVHCDDVHVAKFFEECAKRTKSIRDTDGHLRSAIKGLWAIESLGTLRGFLPVIFNQLFALLTHGEAGSGAGAGREAADLVARDILEFLVFASTALHREERSQRDDASERSPLLRNYVDHIFDVRNLTGAGGETVHGALLKALPGVLESHDRELSDGIVRHVWFFLKLISKSMAQTAFAADPGLKKPRKTRFSAVSDVTAGHGSLGRSRCRYCSFGPRILVPYSNCPSTLFPFPALLLQSPISRHPLPETQDVYERIFRIYIILSDTAIDCMREDHNTAMSVTASMAHWLTDMFAICDRGICFRYMHIFLETLRGAEDLSGFVSACRFEYLRIICRYEHYIALNLPLLSDAIVEAAAPLSR
jgi:hypothetical protein